MKACSLYVRERPSEPFFMLDLIHLYHSQKQRSSKHPHQHGTILFVLPVHEGNISGIIQPDCKIYIKLSEFLSLGIAVRFCFLSSLPLNPVRRTKASVLLLKKHA